MGTRTLLALAIIACLTSVGGHARADETPQPTPTPVTPSPWSKGVSAEDKAVGQKLFVEGNGLFGREKYSAAEAKYRLALRHYDHPSIRFNLAVTLIRMQRLVEAYDHLLRAMRYGAAPFERPELFKEAKTYKQLLEGQLTKLRVTCKLGGAVVTLNGDPLLSCPGIAERTLKPGRHQLVGTKTGYVTLTKNIILLPGKRQTESVALLSIDAATITKRRWKRWKPWALAGGGAIIAAAGVPLLLASFDSRDAYDAHVAAVCRTGCPPEQDVDMSAKERSELQNKLAVSAFVVGGAVLVTGLTMAVLNRPRTVQRTDIQLPARVGTVRVTPTVGRRHAGVSVFARF